MRGGANIRNAPHPNPLPMSTWGEGEDAIGIHAGILGCNPPRAKTPLVYNPAKMSETDGTWTLRRLLEWTSPFFARKGIDSPRLSAELLLAHVLEVPRIKLYTDYDRILDPQHLAAYRQLVRRAAEDEPVAYLTGRAHFFNLEFHVTRDVLIRARTPKRLWKT